MASDPVIPGYNIERELGQGGMARVYLAHEEKLDRPVALKVLLPSLAETPHAAERFLKEARTAGKLRHNGIITVYDVGRHNDTYYMAVEYLEGGSLKELIQKGPLAPEKALAILAKVASSLDYAHGKGFIHRDIKPDNILFREDGEPVLTDFGIAKAVDSATKLTKTGMSIGTPHYMSPEQIRGLDLDGRSDLYSLGIVLYEMLTGKVPYDAADTIAVCMKHVQEPVPRLTGHLAKCQPLLDSLLAKEPAQRFQGGSELINSIDALAGGGGSRARTAGMSADGERSVSVDKEKEPSSRSGDKVGDLAKKIPEGKLDDLGITGLFEKESRFKKSFWLFVAFAIALIIALVMLIRLFTGLNTTGGDERNRPPLVHPSRPVQGDAHQGGEKAFPKRVDAAFRDLDAIYDFADAIDRQHEDVLRDILVSRKIMRGHEINDLIVVTINSIQDYDTGSRSLEDFAANLFNEWEIGKGYRYDGILILISVKDRAARIELGVYYGHEFDQLCSKALDVMNPYFKRSAFGEGLMEGYRYMVSDIFPKIFNRSQADLQDQKRQSEDIARLREEAAASQRQEYFNLLAFRYFADSNIKEATKAWRNALLTSKYTHGILLELDCMIESIKVAFAQLKNQQNEFYVLPKVGRDGRECYLVLWGRYFNVKEANIALKDFNNEYFTRQAVPPTIVELKPYL